MASSRRNFIKFVVAGSVDIVLLFGIAPLEGREPAPSFDIVITNGHIIDGTGSPWYSGDIGIREGKIAFIGNLSVAPRARTIDAHGMVVAPGFIDMLGQSEFTILVDPRLPCKIYQGITTEITGEGESVAPAKRCDSPSDGACAAKSGVNGVPVFDQSKMTGALPGKVLRGPGYVH